MITHAKQRYRVFIYDARSNTWGGNTVRVRGTCWGKGAELDVRAEREGLSEARGVSARGAGTV